VSAILETLRPHLSGVLVSVGSGGLLFIVGWLTRAARRAWRAAQSTPSSMPPQEQPAVPVEHHGAEDDPETSAWIHDVATGPVDEWDAMLRVFNEDLDVELAARDLLFWEAIGPEWTAMVKADRHETEEFLRVVAGVLEDTQQLAVVGVG